VRVVMAQGTLTGTVLAVDDAGRLVLGVGGGRVVLTSADVVHLRDDPAAG